MSDQYARGYEDGARATEIARIIFSAWTVVGPGPRDENEPVDWISDAAHRIAALPLPPPVDGAPVDASQPPYHWSHLPAIQFPPQPPARGQEGERLDPYEYDGPVSVGGLAAALGMLNPIADPERAVVEAERRVLDSQVHEVQRGVFHCRWCDWAWRADETHKDGCPVAALRALRAAAPEERQE